MDKPDWLAGHEALDQGWDIHTIHPAHTLSQPELLLSITGVICILEPSPSCNRGFTSPHRVLYIVNQVPVDERSEEAVRVNPSTGTQVAGPLASHTATGLQVLSMGSMALKGPPRTTEG